MALRDMLYGMTDPEEAQRMEEMLRRMQQASSEADPLKPGAGEDDTMPFAGITVHGGKRYAEMADPVTMDAKRPPKSAEAPSTRNAPERLESGTPPENMRIPQTAPIVQTPRQQAAKMDSGGSAPQAPVGPAAQAPRVPEPDFFDRLGAFSRGYNTGGLVGAIADGFGSGLDRQVETQNQTAQALVKMGLPPELASVAARSPDAMKMILAQALGGNAAPDLKEIEVKDEYGRVTKVPVTWNRATRQFERVDIGGGGPAAGSPSAPMMPTGGGPAAPTAPSAPQAPGFTTTTEPLAGGRAPAPAPQPPADEFTERPININTLPAPMKGYTYDRGKNGYPLFDKQNNPKMIPEKGLESKASAADDAFKLRETVEGIDKTFRLANEIGNHPGLPGVAGRALGGEATIKGMGVDLADLYPGTAEADAFNLHKTLLSDVALRTMDQLKAASAQGATGFGALSEKELAILQSSAGNLKLTSSIEELQRNYRTFQSHLMRARDRLMDKYREKYGEIPEGIVPKQQLIDSMTGDSLSSVDRAKVRPRRLGPFDVPFTSTREPEPQATAPAKPPRGIPEKAPPGAMPVPASSGYPPGTKASRNPNNPNEWIIWTPD